MRQKYNWYLAPTKQEVDRAWTEGFLTVDTNVLLDLYRYHDQTQRELLGALEAFRGRVWLAHQVAEEFIANRTSVIASAAKTFAEADKAIDALQKASQSGIEALTGFRLVPRPLILDLRASTDQAVGDARTALRAAEGAYPNYFRDDPILEQILSLFTEAIGVAPSVEELERLHHEGEERRVAQIPPGYLDKDKDSTRPYGDFILWRQVLLEAKKRKTPVVFVTSERKGDWWEEHSGRRIGPRRELLREAHEVSSQRVLIYQTDQFVEMSAARKGESITEDVVREIQEIGRRRDFERDPAVSTDQVTETAGPRLQVGHIKMRVLRPVYVVTGSGRLDPLMEVAPHVWVELLEKPDGAPQIRVAAGTGTTFDFNVHLRSGVWGTPLPVGDYLLKYTARSHSVQPTSEDEGAAPSPENQESEPLIDGST